MKILDGFKIIPNISLIKDINTILSYTSKRTHLIFRDAFSFTSLFLKVG
jgi:hypothetical protein